ncbi:MAG: hypothetical protein M1308_17260 [Actinobacteria bacterium]|nr:hypothetical protein [Actinomycetota bacterium]
MNYLVIFFVLLISIYPFNYVRYSWNKGRRMAAIGASLLAVTSIILPVIVMFWMQ